MKLLKCLLCTLLTFTLLGGTFVMVTNAASTGLTDVDIRTDATVTFAEDIEYIDVHNAKADGYHFLLGASIVKFGDLWICGYGQSLVKENDTNTRFACKYSEDNCKTWSEEYVIGPIEEAYCRSHGVFYNAGDTLYAFAPRAEFGRPTADINYPGLVMEAYRFNEADRSWTNLGVVLNDAFWPLCEPIEISGDRLLMAGLECKTGTEQAAVAIADKNNPLEWKMIMIPNKSGMGLWGESTVIDYGDRYVLFCRTTAGKYAVSESTDGENWSSLEYTDLAASNTKAYGGTLSTGSRYLIYATESRKHQIIAIGDTDGSYGFTKFYYIRSGFDTTSKYGFGRQWAYPYAVEEDGKLYVVYSEHKENCELAIIPIESLNTEIEKPGISYHNAYASEAELPEHTVIAKVDIDDTWYSGDGVRNGYTDEHIDCIEIDGVKAVAKTQVEASLTQAKTAIQVLRKNFEVDYSKVKNPKQLAFVLTFWSAEDMEADRLTSDARLFFGDTTLKNATANPLNPTNYTTNSRVDYRATTTVPSRDNLWGTVKKGWNTWLVSFGELSAVENFDSMNTFFMIVPSADGMDGEYLFAISSLKIVEIPSDTEDTRTFDSFAPGSMVVDNGDDAFSMTNGEDGTEWAYGIHSSGYNGDYHTFLGPDTSATAKWDFDVDESGEYVVYMWYRQGTNRADAAPVEMHSGDTVRTVEVNQKTNGSMWYELGRFELDAKADNYVLMLATDDNWHIADAVRVQKAWYNDAVDLHAEVKTVISGDLPRCFPDDKIGSLNAAHSALGDILVEETADQATVKAAMDAVNDIFKLREHSFEADAENGVWVCTGCGHSEKIGDIDGDGNVTIQDVLEFLHAILDDKTVENGDLNGDGKVGFADVIRVIKLLLK